MDNLLSSSIWSTLTPFNSYKIMMCITYNSCYKSHNIMQISQELQNVHKPLMSIDGNIEFIPLQFCVCARY